MSDDLIKRLRLYGRKFHGFEHTEAANRIEELMNGVDGLGDAFAELEGEG